MENVSLNRMVGVLSFFFFPFTSHIHRKKLLSDFSPFQVARVQWERGNEKEHGAAGATSAIPREERGKRLSFWN